MRTVALLAALLALHGAGLFLFTSGFFLTRYEVKDASRCEPPLPASRLRRPATTGCWYEQKFQRVVYVVIDALRYDFMARAPAEEMEAKAKLGGRFFLNHLPHVHRVLAAQPAHSLLYRFVADAPTMTMQRLKGLTTGTLPTFLDIKDNMQSTEIVEDSWVQQLVLLNKSIVFMGDNTWDSLYGGKFLRNYSYDSFNVKDLHTVDNGVLDHIFLELQQPDWDVLIAHFLGVDHVGHTHGPNSPFMGAKLDQMDAFLERLFTAVADDTLVVVLGDHGMSEDGNHGGATDDETGAALFLYSKAPLHHAIAAPGGPMSLYNHVLGRRANDLTVAQVDLVPTLALLLGLPIPFGNLGAVIPHLFFTSPSADVDECFERLNAALRVNVAQVRHYFLATSTVRMDLPAMLRLEATYAALEDPDLTPRATHDLLRAYLHDALELSRAMYTQFDLVAMGWGVALLAAAAGLAAAACVPGLLTRPPAAGALVASASVGAAFGGLWPWALVPAAVPAAPLPRAVLCAAVALLLQLAWTLRLRWPPIGVSRTTALLLGVGLCHLLALFSNSYLVVQDKVLGFLGASALAVLGLDVAAARPTPARLAQCALLCALHRVSKDLARPNIVFGTVSVGTTALPLAFLAADSGMRNSYRYPLLWLLVGLSWLGVGPLLLPRLVLAGAAAAAAFDAFAPAMLIVLTLLLGPTAPAVVACFVAQTRLLAALAPSTSIGAHLTGALLLHLFYFATGHHNGFSSLQNAAAFVGFEDFEFYRAGMLLFLNTFGSFFAGAPLLLPTPAARRVAVALFSAAALCTTVFVACQRRHLMVWAIFAPKYIFDGATLLVVNAIALVAAMAERDGGKSA
ncbi:GPI ethanolamine phosphate transferase [Achlya hypogyna]|uniref:GPI ethanolamine phosphate transferase n=1 Tax=Achlya hypogyna TaxID=1202772 RepID=A0A1V9ZUS7_ACHHY|nr:GPI ethanolamine phosphate transferase [Achlya hypogyna]